MDGEDLLRPSIDNHELLPTFSLQNLQENITETCEPFISTAETEPTIIPITPEVIRPYATVVRNRKTNKGRKPGKSGIYTYTFEKN